MTVSAELFGAICVVDGSDWRSSRCEL